MSNTLLQGQSGRGKRVTSVREHNRVCPKRDFQYHTTGPVREGKREAGEGGWRVEEGMRVEGGGFVRNL